MRTRSAKLILLLLLVQLFLPGRLALADTGPKPTMDFVFTQEAAGEPVTIVSGILLECEQPDCSDAAPLEELGPQRFTCEVDSCYAMSYGFSTYHRLEIQFSDARMRQSNIFETAGFESKYTVTIRPADLLVEAQSSLRPALWRIAAILVACVCGLLGLGLLVGSIVFIRRRSAKT